MLFVERSFADAFVRGRNTGIHFATHFLKQCMTGAAGGFRDVGSSGFDFDLDNPAAAADILGASPPLCSGGQGHFCGRICARTPFRRHSLGFRYSVKMNRHTVERG
jgi:hypothetical protein